MKTFRLYKRNAHGREVPQFIYPNGRGTEPVLNPNLPRESPYYFKIQIRGKSHPRCLETNDAAKAQAAAKKLAAAYKEAARTGNLKQLDQTKLRQAPSATVEKLLATYETSPVDAGADARKQNCNALRAILAAAHFPDLSEESTYEERKAKVATLGMHQVNASVVRKWFELAKKKTEAAGIDQATQLSLKVSANSRMSQATGLFTVKAMAAYKDAGIYHESFDEFSKAAAIYEFSKLPKKNYNPPSELILAATLDAWEKLDDRNLFLAIGHELAFGLRAGELAQAKWNWWTVRSGYPVIDGTAEVKNGTAMIQIRALDPFFTIMRTKCDVQNWRGQSDEYIITGTDTFRTDEILRQVSDWMRTLGWETKKTNHALRAYSGSQIAMKYGIYETQIFLRHSSVNVTELHYSHFVQKFKPEDPDTLPIKWAIHNSVPTLTVLPAVSA